MNKKLTIIAFVVFLTIISFNYFNKNGEILNKINKTTSEESATLCYFYSKDTDKGFHDESWIHLNIVGEKVYGEFRYIPREKDSKIGKFEGTISPLRRESSNRTATVWWDAEAEGMTTKEELILEFSENSATVGFGEMIDRGDGVYVYKDKEKLSYIPILLKVSCDDLVEKNSVESYVKDNIKTIATNNPALGGSWYVVSINVDSSLNTGTAIYEDGHIQSKASFEYEYDQNTKNITIKNFLQNK